jgi:hypothetical protein
LAPLQRNRSATTTKPNGRTEEAAMHHTIHDATDPARMRHLEKTGGWTRRERLRILWYRLRLTVQEMNYATRRLVELQTRLP